MYEIYNFNVQCMYNVWYIWYVWNAPHGKIKRFQNWTEHAMIFYTKIYYSVIDPLQTILTQRLPKTVGKAIIQSFLVGLRLAL